MERSSPFELSDNKFYKCGEILFAITVNERIYGFTCIACDELFVKFVEFCAHFETNHSDDLLLKSEETDDVVNAEDNAEYLEEYNELPQLAQIHNETFHDAELLDDTLEEVTSKDDSTLEIDQLIEHNEEESYGEENDDDENVLLDDLLKLTTEDVELEANVTDESHLNECDDTSNCDTFKEDEDEYEEEEEEDDDDEEDEDALASADQKVLKLAIILAYEKQPILWNSKLPSRKGRKFRHEAFEKIAKSVNKQLKLSLTVADVKNMVKLISLNYRNEIHKQKLAQLNGEKRTPPWYFNKLKFLECKTETGKKNEEEKYARKPLGLPLPYFNDEQHTELFTIFKQFPSLWDVHDVGFHTKKMRDKALNDMVAVVNEKMELDYTADKLRRKIYQIRYACSKEKYQKLDCERRNDKPFKSTCKYYDEIKFLEPHVQPFKCPYCDEIFGYPHKFVLHRAEHDGSLPYKCSICKHGFKLAANCVVHMRRHTQEFPYSCKVCGKGFASSTEVTLHMRHHNGERPFVCEICGRSFFTPTSLEYHKRRHVNDRSFKCTVCLKAFYDNYQLKQHVKCHLNVRDKVCNVCGKAFNLTKHLRQHIQIHDEKKKYSCKICGKNFSQSAGLSGHMKTHGTTKSAASELKCGDVDTSNRQHNTTNK